MPRGDGWRREWAQSPFTGHWFTYIVLEAFERGEVMPAFPDGEVPDQDDGA